MSGSAACLRTSSRRAGRRALRPGIEATYRLLQIRGLEASEAANLMAWLTGIPVREHRWAIREVNSLVFLRQITRAGRFGPKDGLPR